jgi:TIGR03009 family protein
MRFSGLAFSLLFAAASASPGQTPSGSNSPVIPVPGGANPTNSQPANLVPPVLDPQNRLDALLLQWEQRMKSVESIWAKDLVRTEKEKTGEVRVLKGEARYLKPNLAALRMIREDNPALYELYISTGQFLYDYRPKSRKLYIHPLQGGQFQNNFLSFLFGINAIDAKQRYELTLTKENKDFIYIKISPRFDAEKREFAQAQLVLQAGSMLPRRLWFEHPNGMEVTWDIPIMDTAQKLTPKDFVAPAAPAGWETVRVKENDLPASSKGGANAPRIVRPAGQ